VSIWRPFPAFNDGRRTMDDGRFRDW